MANGSPAKARRLWLLVMVLVAASCGEPQPTRVRVSEFGVYEGYSEVLYDEWTTRSLYIETRDGTKLAADISLPAVDGAAVDEPFPVLWTYTRYHRRSGQTPDIDHNEGLQRLIRHGYVIAIVNVRGGGASFGRYEGLFSAAETRDAYDVIDWLSKQHFSNGVIGMYGGSYLGITQYMAASAKHPALKAIMPEVSYFNFYDALRRGGILREDQVRNWAEGTRYLDKEKPPVPVDADTDGSMAAQAVLEHADNFDPTAPLAAAPYRDSTAPEFDWLSDMPSAVIDDLNEVGLPIYHVGAWHDAYTTDTLLLYANYTGPDKLMMGSWAHEPSNDKERAERSRIWSAEIHRWYDYWLKGIDNGIMDDPDIHIAVMDTPRVSWSWVALDALPDDSARVSFFFGDEPSNHDPRLPNDLQLQGAPPAHAAAYDYQVNPETTTGTSTRWDSNFGGVADYPDMTANDARALTFTTASLEEDVVVVGVPIATVYLSASTPDADVYVLLEEVDSAGVSHYASEGMLRASLRKELPAPWDDNLGLPWHRAYAGDRQPLRPGEIVELHVPLQPLAYRFNAGNRVRIAIMGADKDNTEAPPFPNAHVSVQLGGDQASRVSLPVMSEPGGP